MLSTLPGGGLGFTGAKLIAFGLGAVTEEEIIIPQSAIVNHGGGGGMSWWLNYEDDNAFFKVVDNAYSRRKDDSEIIDFLTILFRVIE